MRFSMESILCGQIKNNSAKGRKRSHESCNKDAFGNRNKCKESSSEVLRASTSPDRPESSSLNSTNNIVTSVQGSSSGSSHLTDYSFFADEHLIVLVQTRKTGNIGAVIGSLSNHTLLQYKRIIVQNTRGTLNQEGREESTSAEMLVVMAK
uniref:Uncharacterized protein n=1 Tax=Brugia malayi TaxID=6279 RepID=A8Q3U5_BRUMA